MRDLAFNVKLNAHKVTNAPAVTQFNGPIYLAHVDLGTFNPDTLEFDDAKILRKIPAPTPTKTEMWSRNINDHYIKYVGLYFNDVGKIHHTTGFYSNCIVDDNGSLLRIFTFSEQFRLPLHLNISGSITGVSIPVSVRPYPDNTFGGILYLWEDEQLDDRLAQPGISHTEFQNQYNIGLGNNRAYFNIACMHHIFLNEPLPELTFGFSWQEGGIVNFEEIPNTFRLYKKDEDIVPGVPSPQYAVYSEQALLDTEIPTNVGGNLLKNPSFTTLYNGSYIFAPTSITSSFVAPTVCRPTYITQAGIGWPYHV